MDFEQVPNCLILVLTVVANVVAANRRHWTATSHDKLIVITHIIRGFRAHDVEFVEIQSVESMIDQLRVDGIIQSIQL